MVGWPGSVHDARVLSKSQLYRKVVGKEVLNTSSCTINGVTISVRGFSLPTESMVNETFPPQCIIIKCTTSF